MPRMVKIVKIAVKYRMPVVPFSGGTSLEGHYLAVSVNSGRRSVRKGLTAYGRVQPSVGGICIDMHRMDKIIEIHGMVEGYA